MSFQPCSDETHFSTQQSETPPATRLSGAHGDPLRTQYSGYAAQQRAQATVGLNTTVPVHCRFPVSHRLRSPSDFRTVFRTARSFRQHSRGFELLARPHPRAPNSHNRPNDRPQAEAAQPLSPCRLGIQITKKHIKQAVHRNRVRRLMREFFRTRRRTTAACYDLVLRSKPALAQLTGAEFVADLSGSMKRLERKLGAEQQ